MAPKHPVRLVQRTYKFDEEIADHHQLLAAKKAISVFILTHHFSPPPSSILDQNAGIFPHAVSGTILIPLWNTTPEFKDIVKTWDAKQWATFRALMMALAPVLEMRAEIFKEQFPTQYTTARDWYSHMKGDRLIDPKLASPALPFFPHNRTFASLRLSANLAPSTAPLSLSPPGQDSARWAVMFGVGDYGNVRVQVQDSGKMYVLEKRSTLIVRPGVEVGVLPFGAEWFMLEGGLPWMREVEDDEELKLIGW